MENISKFEQEKILNLLECTEQYLDKISNNTDTIIDETNSLYDSLLKVLQQGYNIREATLAGIILGQKIGYENAKIEMEDEIKEKLYRAFKNSQ